MKAIILAAGNGTRMRPLTKNLPKPLLGSVNQTILEHNLSQLSGLVDEVLLVISPNGNLIKEKIGKSFAKIKIKYVIQDKQLGTGHAFLKASGFIKNKFLLLNGDDLYDRKDIQKCLERLPSILLSETKTPNYFGVVSTEKECIKELNEKPLKPKTCLVNTGLYFLDKSILDYKIQKSSRGEYEFTDYIKKLVLKHKLYFVIAKSWIPASYPWNLFEINSIFLDKAKRSILGKVEKNCQIKGKVIIGKGTIVKSGTYIEGPVYIGKNCTIGPNSFIRAKTSIGCNSRIGQSTEVKNSIIGEGFRASHLSYIGDSIIGKNCNLGAGTILANLRFDNKTIKSLVKGNIIETHREKFGCVIGNNVSIGANSSVMPGIFIGENSIIGPNSLARQNIEDNMLFYSEFKSVVKKRNL